MRVSVGDCRLYVDVDGLGLVPDGPTMRERPTVVVLHGGPGADHTGLKPAFGAPTYADVQARGLAHANLDVFQQWQAGEERTFDLRGSLDRIACPVLVLAGEDDPICPASGSRAIAAGIGPERCTLRVVPDCGHGVWRDRPEVGFEAMRAFVAG